MKVLVIVNSAINVRKSSSKRKILMLTLTRYNVYLQQENDQNVVYALIFKPCRLLSCKFT